MSLDFICSIFDEESLNLSKKIGLDAYKIASPDLTDLKLISKIKKVNKPIILSTGMSSYNEIKNAIKWVNKSCNLWLMYGYQLFPTNPKKINLRFLQYLKNKYKIRIGYQDHSPYDISGFTVPATAIGAGIDIIEKHVTDHNKRNGTDGQSAIEIKNYKLFTEKCEEVYLSLGEGKKFKFSKEEKIYRIYSKKVILFNKNLEKNHILKIDDLIFLRTGKKGVMIDYYKKFLGKRLIKNVKKYESANYNLIKK